MHSRRVFLVREAPSALARFERARAPESWTCSVVNLVPSEAAIASFKKLVDSVSVDGEGGDRTSRTIRMRLFGESNQQVEFPESTSPTVYEISRELFAIDHVRRNFQHEEVVDKILIAASAAAIARVKGKVDESELRRAYAEIGKNPQPIRMLLQVAPRLHFADDAVTVGDVTLYRATEEALRSRWPKLFEWDVAMRDRAVRDIKDKMVAELTIAASEGRAEEVAAERLTATLGVVG